jgi:hypothetical protein
MCNNGYKKLFMFKNWKKNYTYNWIKIVIYERNTLILTKPVTPVHTLHWYQPFEDWRSPTLKLSHRYTRFTRINRSKTTFTYTKHKNLSFYVRLTEHNPCPRYWPTAVNAVENIQCSLWEPQQAYKNTVLATYGTYSYHWALEGSNTALTDIKNYKLYYGYKSLTRIGMAIMSKRHRRFGTAILYTRNTDLG